MWYLPPTFVRSDLLITSVLVAAALVIWGERGGLYLGLLILSTVLVWWSWKRIDRPTNWSKLITAGFLLICIIGLLWPSLVGIITISAFIKARVAVLGAPVVGQDLLIFSLFFSAIMYSLLRCAKGEADWRFLVLASVVFLLLRGVYVFAVHMEPKGDYASLWRFAERASVHGVSSISNLLFVRRIFLYFLPLQYVFGASPAVYKIANLCVTTASSLLVFFLTREWFGSRAARIAYVVSLMAVEVWLAAGIPTHEIPGAFFTLLALFCFTQAARQLPTQPSRAALYSLACGLLVVLLDLQRNTGPILLVACLLVGAATVAERYLQTRRDEKAEWFKPIAETLVVLLILPLLASKVFEYPVQQAGWTLTWSTRPEWLQKRMYTNIAAHTDSWGTGRYGYWRQHWWPKRNMPLDRWPHFVRRKLLSDIYLNPLGRVTLYHRKAALLFRLDQLGIYVHGATIWEGGNIDERREQRILLLNNVFAVLFLGCLVVGSLSVWKHTTRMSVALLPMVYMSLLSGALIFLSEVAPSYMFLLWFIGAMYIGALFRQDTRDESGG